MARRSAAGMAAPKARSATSAGTPTARSRGAGAGGGWGGCCRRWWRAAGGGGGSAATARGGGGGGGGVRFVALLPQLTPSGVGDAGVTGYAERQGVDRDAFIAAMAPVLTPDVVAKAVLEAAADPVSEHLVTAAGLRPVG